MKRKSEKITQSQLSFETGLTRLQIGRIERGEVDCTLSSMFAILHSLDSNFEEFEKYIAQKKPPFREAR